MLLRTNLNLLKSGFAFEVEVLVTIYNNVELPTILKVYCGTEMPGLVKYTVATGIDIAYSSCT